MKKLFFIAVVFAACNTPADTQKILDKMEVEHLKRLDSMSRWGEAVHAEMVKGHSLEESEEIVSTSGASDSLLFLGK